MTTPFYVSYGLMWVLIVFLTMLSLGLVRALANSAPASAQEAAEPAESMRGRPLPAFTVEDLNGTEISSESWLGRQMALLFVSPNCPSCATSLQEIDALMSKVDGNVIVFCISETDRCENLADHYNLKVPVVWDADRRIADLLQIFVPPTAVIVDEAGVITSTGFPVGGDQLVEMFPVVQVNESAAG